MRNFFDSFIWAFLVLFSVPTLLIVASWNTIPGEGFFPVKLGLEKTLAFVVSPSYAASGQLQIKYTERRFADAQRGLAERHSVAGLAYLEEQVATTKKTISRVGDAKTKTQLTDSYIQTLEDVSAALETQKNSVAKPAQVIPTPTPTMTNTSIVILQKNSIPTPTPTPTSIPTSTLTPVAIAQVSTTASISTQNAMVAIQITNTQQTIKETIKELKEEKKKNEKEGEKDDNEQFKGKKSR